jgi:hypothetical protein
MATPLRDILTGAQWGDFSIKKPLISQGLLLKAVSLSCTERTNQKDYTTISTYTQVYTVIPAPSVVSRLKPTLEAIQANTESK